jgi:hypothetical protein
MMARAGVAEANLLEKIYRMTYLSKPMTRGSLK